MNQTQDQSWTARLPIAGQDTGRIPRPQKPRPPEQPQPAQAVAAPNWQDEINI